MTVNIRQYGLNYLPPELLNKLEAAVQEESEESQTSDIFTARVVATITARNSIPAIERFAGMIVRVVTDVTNGDGRLYELGPGLANSNWFDAGIPIGRLTKRFSTTPTVVGSDGFTAHDFVWQKTGVGEVFFNLPTYGDAQVAATLFGEGTANKLVKFSGLSLSYIQDSRITDPGVGDITIDADVSVTGNVYVTGNVNTPNFNLQYTNLVGGRILVNSNAGVWDSGVFALSSGWGSTASVGTIKGNDAAAEFVVTAAGAGIGADPMITITYSNEWFNAAPYPFVELFDSSDTGAFTVAVIESATTTVLTITYKGTPVSGDTYSFRQITFGQGS